MQIEVQELEYCKLQINYEADPELIESKRAEVITQFKNAPVPGNRPGRASLDAIRIYYYSQIEEALKKALAEQAYHDAVFQKNIKPFGAPNFSDITLSRKKFTCSFNLNSKPTFELTQYKDLEIPKQPVPFNSTEEVEKILEGLRNRFGESQPYTETDFVQSGDIIIIDSEAFDGEAKIASASGEGQIITVSQSGVPGLDDNLLGMKLNEVRIITIKAPETSLPSLAGKDIKFVITLVMGSKVTPLPLNDELAVKAGKKTLDELRTYVAGLAQAKQQEMERTSATQQVMAHLLAKHEIKLPSWLILSEAQYLATSANIQWDTLTDPDREQYLTMGEHNVKTSLLLDKIREEEPEAQLSDQEVLMSLEQNVAKTLQTHPVRRDGSQEFKTTDDIMIELNKSGRLPLLASRIRDEHTFDFLIKNTRFIE